MTVTVHDISQYKNTQNKGKTASMFFPFYFIIEKEKELLKDNKNKQKWEF